MSTHGNENAQRKQVSAGAMAPMLALEAYTRARVSRGDSHLIRLRVSAVNDCRFCTAMHRRDARRDGWGDARIITAEDWPAHAAELHPGDLAVLRFADAITHIHGEDSVSDGLWEDVVRHRGEAGTGQLLMEVVTINAWNRIAVTTRKDPGSLRGVRREDIDPVRPGS